MGAGIVMAARAIPDRVETRPSRSVLCRSGAGYGLGLGLLASAYVFVDSVIDAPGGDRPWWAWFTWAHWVGLPASGLATFAAAAASHAIARKSWPVGARIAFQTAFVFCVAFPLAAVPFAVLMLQPFVLVLGTLYGTRTLGVPCVVVTALWTWLYLARLCPPAGRETAPAGRT